MNFGQYRDPSPPLPSYAIIALAAFYLLAGVTGHDPWKAEDAIHISIAHGFATEGNWLIPRIAGEAWPHTPPFYHWVAALLGKLLGGLLGFHNAARLATPLFGAIFLIAVSGAARSLNGEAAGRIAPLLAIGTLGLLLPMHEAQPAVAGLAFAAMAWWGAGLLLHGAPRGAWLLGVGCGLAFATHGLLGMLMVIPVLPVPLFQRNLKALLLVIMLAIPLAAAWPLLLAYRLPASPVWSIWWQNEFAEATFARGLPEKRHLKQLVWLTWPALPLALWSLWRHRGKPAQFLLPLIGSLLGLLWFFSGTPRSLAILPTLLPLIVLAAGGASLLRRGAANAFDWFGMVTFTIVAALIWLGASAQALEWPPRIARNFARIAPGHEVNYSLIALGTALAATLAWVFTWRLPRASWRATLRWASGATLMWLLVSTLWLSWLDHAKSYRGVTESLKAALPAQVDCIERIGINTTERASLDYFTGIHTMPPPAARNCHWRLVDGDKDRPPPAGWQIVWQGRRPLDRDNLWTLEQRKN